MHVNRATLLAPELFPLNFNRRGGKQFSCVRGEDGVCRAVARQKDRSELNLTSSTRSTVSVPPALVPECVPWSQTSRIARSSPS